MVLLVNRQAIEGFPMPCPIITQEMLEEFLQLGQSGSFSKLFALALPQWLNNLERDFQSSLNRRLEVHCDLDETLTTREGATSLPFDPSANQLMGIDKAIKVLNGDMSLINQPLANVLRTCLEQGKAVEIITNQILRPVVNAYAAAAGLGNATIKTASPDSFCIQGVFAMDRLDTNSLKALASQDKPVSAEFLQAIQSIYNRYGMPILILVEDKSKHIVSKIKTLATKLVKKYFTYADDVDTNDIAIFENEMRKIVYPYIDIVFIDDRDSNLKQVSAAVQTETPHVNLICINPRNENYINTLKQVLSSHVDFSKPRNSQFWLTQETRLCASQDIARSENLEAAERRTMCSSQ